MPPIPRKEMPVTAHNPPTNDRAVFVRWLGLFGFAVVLMFLGALWLFSLLPGVDANALYAPIHTAWSGSVWGILGVMGGIGAFVVAWKGIAPVVLAHYHPDRKAERDLYNAAVAERNEARADALAAEERATKATARADGFAETILGEYTALYGSQNVANVPYNAMLAAMRVELLILRPTAERLDRVVRERDDLRTELADVLNRPVPTPVAWVDLLPIVEYGGRGNITVKGLRDVLRKVVTIPEGEYALFSNSVRSLEAYSPAKRGTKSPPALTVEGVVSANNTMSDGRNSPVTDVMVRSRTQSKRRTKLPTAKMRGKVEVNA
jgi:hypothetical protein